MKGTRITSLAVLAISAALLSLPARAGDGDPAVPPRAKETEPDRVVKEKTAAKPAAQAPAVGTAGRIIARDPETGELRAATPDEVKRLRGSRRTTLSRPMVQRVLPDGTVELDPGERGLAYATLEKRPDGTLKPGCAVGREPSKPASAQAGPAAEEK